MQKNDQRLYLGEIVILQYVTLYDAYKRENLWTVYNPKRNRSVLAYEHELMDLPSFVQDTDTTWHIVYNSRIFRIHKYFDGGYTISTIEGIFNSQQDVLQYLINWY